MGYNRGTLTDRKGVNLAECFFTDNYDWAFRDQPILDYGIDAIVEQRCNNNPTGRLIALQIKAGDSYIVKNADGNIDYYIKPIHLEYWLNYQLPVVLLICDIENKNLFWKQVAKRNLIKTSDNRFKITFTPASILTKDSLSELEAILDTYSTQNCFDADISSMTISEVSDYVTELFDYCNDALMTISDATITFQHKMAEWKENIQSIFNDLNTGLIHTESEKIRRQNNSLKSITLATNIFKQRLSGNDKQIALDTHISALCFIDKLSTVENSYSEEIETLINSLIDNECREIKSLIITLKELSTFLNNSTAIKNTDYKRAMVSCSIALDDYAADLQCLTDILSAKIHI